MPHVGTATSFGAMLYQARQQQRMSVAQASKLAGISRSYFSELENSKRNAPRHPTVLKIASGLALSEDQKKRLIRLADEQRFADQLTKHLPTEFRCLVLRICANAITLDISAARSLHAHLDLLSRNCAQVCDT